MGFRPDDPSFETKSTDPCGELKKYIDYALNLKEAYRSRATQNRFWLYAAAISGLGMAAAGGALAAAGAVAAGTLGVLAITGGFTAATFATINNSELANVYTVSANDIGSAISYTEGRVARCRSSEEECRAQLAYLVNAVTTARNTLETARTDTAAGALTRAAAQRKMLDEEIAKFREQDDAQTKAKDAADKRKEANKAKEDLETAKKEEDRAKEDVKKADASSREEAIKKLGAAEQNVKTRKDTAESKEKEAKEAEEKKRQADIAARSAAMAPVTPVCLTLPGKVLGKMSASRAARIRTKAEFGKVAAGRDPLDLVVENVDLKSVSDRSPFRGRGWYKGPRCRQGSGEPGLTSRFGGLSGSDHRPIHRRRRVKPNQGRRRNRGPKRRRRKRQHSASRGRIG